MQTKRYARFSILNGQGHGRVSVIVVEIEQQRKLE